VIAAEGIAPQTAHRLDIFARALRAPLPRDAERAKLFFEPADANAERHTAFAQTIEGGDHFRQHQRIVFGDEADRRAEPDFLGHRSERT
jgi:hypothetical protein